jgi:hypothetical protein
LVDFDDTVFKGAYYLILFQLRRRERIEIRIIASGEELWFDAQFKNFAVGKDGPRKNVKLNVTIVAEPEMHEKIMTADLERARSTRHMILGLKLEAPTKEDLKRMGVEEKVEEGGREHEYMEDLSPF